MSRRGRGGRAYTFTMGTGGCCRVVETIAKDPLVGGHGDGGHGDDC